MDFAIKRRFLVS